LQTDILALPPDILADYLRLSDLLAVHGPQMRLPHSRAMGEGLFELRPRGREGVGRVFYCFLSGRRVVMLHTFIKKSQETPLHELKIARQRMKEMKNADT
jgi:phage-related protein